MGGICGRLNYRTHARAERDSLAKMCARIAHRGAEDPDLHVVGPVGLGIVSAAPTAASASARPPGAGDVTVVYAGEIYNLDDLRQREQTSGGSQCRSDCELLARLFEREGARMAESLCGMFAIAAYDRRSGALTLIRDRMGEQPLFYCETSQGVLFASEIKCFLDQPDFEPRLREPSLHEFLTLGYVPGPDTIFEGVQQAPAGGYVEIGGGRGARRGLYWILTVTEDRNIRASTALRNVRALFERSVQRRVADAAPLGIYLSGGLDSVAVLAAAAAAGRPAQRAFTTSFGARNADDVECAARAASEFGVPHEVVDCEPGDVEVNFARMVYHADNLLANPAGIATLALARAAGRELHNVLSGAGGDELFFGSAAHDGQARAALLRMFPKRLLKLAAAGVRKFAPRSHERPGLASHAGKLLATALESPQRAHFQWRAALDDETRGRLLVSATDAPADRAFQDALRRRAARSPLAAHNAADLETWWRDSGLYQADTLNMAHGVAPRLPFMDQDLVDYVARIPAALKYSRGRGKRLWREAVAGLAPDWARERKKSRPKMPLASWFAGPLRAWLRGTLEPDRLRRVGVLEPGEAQRLCTEHELRQADHSLALWNLACFVQWHELFIQGGHREFLAQPARESRPKATSAV